MKVVKSLISIFVLCALLCSMLTATATESREINVTIDGTKLTFTDAKPFADTASRTQIPLRAVSEGLGYGVQWDQESNSVYVFEVRDTGTKIKCLNFILNSSTVYILEANGKGFVASDDISLIESKITSTGEVITFEMDTIAQVIDNRTYVPLRYIAELLNKNVNWNQDTFTVEIMT